MIVDFQKAKIYGEMIHIEDISEEVQALKATLTLFEQGDVLETCETLKIKLDKNP